MFKRILVPVDGSNTSTCALAAALDMAHGNGGQVHLVHVLDDLAYLTGYDLYGGVSGEIYQLSRDAGAKVLADAMGAATLAGVPADTEFIEKIGNRLGETVADAALAWKADLVVLGTHGRRGVGRALLGSGAEQIIRMAPVPVLVIRSTETPAPTAA